MKDIIKYHAVSPIIGVLLLLAITVLLYAGLSLIGFNIVDVNSSPEDQINNIDRVEITADGRITVKEDLDGATIVWESADGTTGNLTAVGDTVQVDDLRVVYAVTDEGRSVIYSANDNDIEFDNPPDPGEPGGNGSISDGGTSDQANKSDIELTSIDISGSDIKNEKIKSVDIDGSISTKGYQVTISFNENEPFSQEVTDDGDFSTDEHKVKNAEEISVKITIENTESGATEGICESTEDLTENTDLDSLNKFDCY